MSAVSFTIDLNLVKAMSRSVGIENFVETGAFKGETLEVIRNYYKTINSIEFSFILHAKAVGI